MVTLARGTRRTAPGVPLRAPAYLACLANKDCRAGRQRAGGPGGLEPLLDAAGAFAQHSFRLRGMSFWPGSAIGRRARYGSLSQFRHRPITKLQIHPERAWRLPQTAPTVPIAVVCSPDSRMTAGPFSSGPACYVLCEALVAPCFPPSLPASRPPPPAHHRASHSFSRRRLSRYSLYGSRTRSHALFEAPHSLLHHALARALYVVATAARIATHICVASNLGIGNSLLRSSR